VTVSLTGAKKVTGVAGALALALAFGSAGAQTAANAAGMVSARTIKHTMQQYARQIVRDYDRAAPSGVGRVYFNDPGSTGPVEPTAFGPVVEPFDGQYYVFDVTWASWGDPEATGTGRVRVTNDAEIADPVTISLNRLVRCHGQLMYTQYALGVAPGGVPGFEWARVKSGQFPCQVTAGNAITPRYPGRPNDYTHCVNFDTGRWAPALTPSPPVKPNSTSEFCGMQWSGFGHATTVGLGISRDLFWQWPVKAELSGIAWCPGTDSATALSYTRLSMKTYGKGAQTVTTTDQADNQEARLLRREIGRRGVKVRAYRYTKPITPHCVRLSSG
jgi:hypothetical protein